MTERHHAPTSGQLVRALCAAPYLPALGMHLDGARTGRPRKHPAWVPLAYGALTRHFKSSNHTDAELANGLWELLCKEAANHGLDDPGTEPFQYWHYQYWRNQLAHDDDRRTSTLETFTHTALEHANATGLLVETAGGSLTRPSPRRTIYGDGTVVRPAFRPPADNDDEEADDADAGRQDPDCAVHHRHDGPIHGSNYVIVSTRQADAHSRIILGLDHVPRPGLEADTALALIQRVADIAGPGLQAVVYDGAFQGTHIDTLMRSHGLVVVNRLAAARRHSRRRATPKQRPLGTYTHQTRRGPCAHVLHTNNGQVVEVAISDDGTPTIIDTTTRKQVRRVRRADGTYRFHLGIHINCPNGNWITWISPHAGGARDTLPERVRLIPPDDPYFTTLYALRNDAESLNSQYKRTLLVDRAASIGWQRQLIDLLHYAIAHNSRGWCQR